MCSSIQSVIQTYFDKYTPLTNTLPSIDFFFFLPFRFVSIEMHSYIYQANILEHKRPKTYFISVEFVFVAICRKPIKWFENHFPCNLLPFQAFSEEHSRFLWNYERFWTWMIQMGWWKQNRTKNAKQKYRIRNVCRASTFFFHQSEFECDEGVCCTIYIEKCM